MSTRASGRPGRVRRRQLASVCASDSRPGRPVRSRDGGSRIGQLMSMRPETTNVESAATAPGTYCADCAATASGTRDERWLRGHQPPHPPRSGHGRHPGDRRCRGRGGQRGSHLGHGPDQPRLDQHPARALRAAGATVFDVPAEFGQAAHAQLGLHRWIAQAVRQYAAPRWRSMASR